MKNLVFGALLAACVPSAAFAQSLNNSIADYSPDLFRSCYAGNDIGQMFGVSNPILLLGSLAYLGPVMQINGTTKTGWVREPLSLPITVTEAVDPDVTTCNFEFEAVANGSLGFLGINVSAQRSEVYKVAVRLLSRQQLATVAENGSTVRIWNANSYANQFRSAIGGAPTSVNDFFLFDNISIYLVQVERYKKQGGGITAGIGLFSGGATYKRDDTFKGTRLLVTGDPIPLNRDRFKIVPTLASTDTTITAAVGTVEGMDLGRIENALRVSAISAD